MSCQDMAGWPPVSTGDLDYYEERATQNEMMAYDQGQQVSHPMQDRQTGGHEFAQAYAAAVSLAASRLQPSLNIGDEINTDTEMPDLPEVLDLHQPLPHRNAAMAAGGPDVDAGGLFVLPPQDQFSGLPVLHFDKNTLLDFFQSPQQDRQSGQRYIESNSQVQSSSYNTASSSGSQSISFLENYAYPSLPPLMQNGHQQGNQNYPINHKQMLAQKYAAEELQNSAYSHIFHGNMDMSADHAAAALHQICGTESLIKDDGTTDMLEATIVGVDLSLSKSHANTSLCPQNRIPSQIVNRQEGVMRPPKKERLHQGRRSPVPKDNFGIFCDECGLVYERECTLHRVVVIEDQKVQPRAFASLPTNHLMLQNLSAPGTAPIYGVFSKKPIPSRTVFGPMEGVAVHLTHNPNLTFPIFLSDDKASGCVLLDTKDDDRSNWMRFVRCACTPAEQNLVLIQQGSQIYFKSIVQIEPKTELKVWYSDAYAQRYRALFSDEYYVGFDGELQFASTADVLLQQIVGEHQNDHELQSRKPKNRYNSGQWPDTSRQAYPNQGVNSMEEPTSFCDSPDVSRRSKRPNNYPQMCLSQDLLPYNPEKPLDTVEIIEHITQAIRDCSTNLPNDIANNFCPLTPTPENPGGIPEPPKDSEFFSDRCVDFPVDGTPPASEKTHSVDQDNFSRKKRDHKDKNDTSAKADEPKAATSKITKFLQRHNEELARSPESISPTLMIDLSPRSDDSRESRAEEQAPLPQQKRLIKNIKNKHYVRADSNIGGVESPLPSEESVDTFETDFSEISSNLTQHSIDSPASPKASTAPLKKNLPKRIPHEYNPAEAGDQDCEVQSSEISSAAEALEPSQARKEDPKKREFPCLLCDERFTSNEVLRSHSSKHREPEGFRCTHCQRVYEDYMLVRRHIKLYHICPTTKSYRCEVCGKTFCHTDKYKRHLRVHESLEKKFRCECCGKTLSRKDKLVEHMRNMHPSDKQDLNQQNQSPDSTQPQLNTPEKCRLKREGAGLVRETFHCDQCQKAFRKRGMLAQHYAKEHPDVPLENTPLNEEFDKVISEFPCPYCAKSYKSSTKRKQHILRKHPNKEVPQSYKTMAASVKSSCVRCPWCPSQFTVRCKMYSHQRNKHKELLDILEMTGLTEDVWEKKIPPNTKERCIELLNRLKQTPPPVKLKKEKSSQDKSSVIENTS